VHTQYMYTTIHMYIYTIRDPQISPSFMAVLQHYGKNFK